MTQSIFPDSLDRFVVSRTPADALADAINKMQADLRNGWAVFARHHGCRFDGLTDDTDHLQDAIDAVPDDGGLLILPPGEAVHSAALDVSGKTGLTIMGMGKTATKLVGAHTGSGIVSREALNGTTSVHLVLRDLGIENTNAANGGAAFEQVAGTFVHLHRVRTSGFRYGVVLDQSELTDLDECDFEFPLVGGVWLVIGPDHTSGASPDPFTNRISITRCQFNAPASAGRVAVIDDGGYAHRIRACNFNGWERHIRVAAGAGFSVADCEFEGALEESLVTAGTAYESGRSVGVPPVVRVSDNLFIPATGKRAVLFGGGDAVVVGNYFSTATVPLQGCGNLGVFVHYGNTASSAATLTDFAAGWGEIGVDRPPTAAGPVKVNRLQLLEAAARIVGGGTSLALRNNADSANNVLVADGGAVTLRNGLEAVGYVLVTGEGAWVGFGGTNSLLWDSSFGPVLNSSGDVIVNVDADNNQSDRTFRVRHDAASGGGGGLLFEVNESGDAQIVGALDHNGSTAGFFGTAPTTKPTVTGSRGGNAALASLLTALAGLGLLTDSSSA